MVPWSILDIDADQAARERRRSALENTGWKLFPASSHMDALHVFSEIRPDVVLLTASGQDLGFCRQLKNNIETAATAILIISSEQYSSSHAEALKAGADAWLSEPVEASELIDIVEALATRTRWDDYRSLVQHAPVGLYRTTPDGRILMANPALVSMFGFDSFEEFAKSNPDKVQFHRQLDSQGTIEGIETAWTRSDGTTLFVRESARAVRGPDGNVAFYEGIVEDYLRESEDHFRAMFEQASVGVVRSTLDARFLVVNDRFCEITGYSRPELLTMTYRNLTHPDDMSATEAYGQNLLRGERQPAPFDKRYIRKDHSLVYVRLFLSLFRNKDGSPHSFFAFVEDITARKLAEQALQREFQFDKDVADLLTLLATCSAADIDPAVVAILRLLADYCRADHAYITQGLAGHPKLFRITHQWCASYVHPHAQVINADAYPWSARKALAKEVIVLSSLDDLPPEADVDRANLEQEGACALLHVPIEGHQEQVVGCIGLHHQQPKDWACVDIARLRIIGNAIAAILERKRAEEDLRGSEAKFAAVFETCPEGILISSVPDQRIVDVNPAFSTTTGYMREEVLGKTMAELQLEVNAEHRIRAWSELLEKGKTGEFDLAVRTKSGAVKTGVGSSVLVKVQQRQYAFFMFRDLTWLLQAEQALRHQAAFQQDALGLLSDFITSPASELARIVDQALHSIATFFAADHVFLLEVSPETRTWRITREWCAPHVKPMGSQGCFWTGDKLFSDVDARFDVEELDPAAGYDLDKYRKEGATFVMNVPTRGAEGVITGRIGLHRHGDRTPWTPEDASRLRLAGNAIAGILERSRADKALRESEQRLREIADKTPLLTWISDPDRRVAFFNNQAMSFAGAPLERIIGDGWIDFLHPEDRLEFLRVYYAAVDAHTPLSSDVRVRRADGEWRWLLVNGVPRFTEGAYSGHIGTAVDITDLKRGFEQHLAAQKLESLGVLAAGVAHDFNNLLGSIISHADCAQSELEPGSPAAEHVDEITKIGLRAAGVVAQMIMFAGQETASFEPINLSHLVAEIVGLMRVSISKTAVLETNLPADLPLVRANIAEMRQLVMNLVINASEALDKNPGTITIATSLTPQGDYLRLEVSDTGCGMDDEMKSKIFDPFFSTKFIGRGLGLSVVQGIVRRHNGFIEVESSPGKGTCFAVLLPCAPVTPD